MVDKYKKPTTFTSVGSSKKRTITKRKIKLNKETTNKEHVHGDADDDGIPNIDDLFPYLKSDKRVDKVSLSKELKKYELDLREFKKIQHELARDLELIGFGEVQSSVQTLYSTINLLRKRHLEARYPNINKEYKGTKSGSSPEFKQYKGLSDVVGTKLILNNMDELRKAKRKIQDNFQVIKFDNYYANPKDTGYRAYHFIVLKDNIPVEIQLLTKRVNTIIKTYNAAHEAGLIDSRINRYFHELSFKADLGKKEAEKEFNLYDFEKTRENFEKKRRKVSKSEKELFKVLWKASKSKKERSKNFDKLLVELLTKTSLKDLERFRNKIKRTKLKSEDKKILQEKLRDIISNYKNVKSIETEKRRNQSKIRKKVKLIYENLTDSEKKGLEK